MKVATYNVNGVNGRLPVLLRWLEEYKPDIVCLQEIKAPPEKFPEKAIRDAGYGVIWHGQKSYNGVAILAVGRDPVETSRGLPGDPEDLHSRYLEATVDDLTIGCLYLPNGNPAPGPKFDYKLRWFERLKLRAAELVKRKESVVLAGDYNVMPTDIDVYQPERLVDDSAYSRPRSRHCCEFRPMDRCRVRHSSLTSIARKSPPSQLSKCEELADPSWKGDCRPGCAAMLLRGSFCPVGGICHGGEARDPLSPMCEWLLLDENYCAAFLSSSRWNA